MNSEETTRNQNFGVRNFDFCICSCFFKVRSFLDSYDGYVARSRMHQRGMAQVWGSWGYYLVNKSCKAQPNKGSLFSQDNSVGSAIDWCSEGLGFKSHHLQLNFQLEKGYGRDSKHYAIKYICVASNLNIYLLVPQTELPCMVTSRRCCFVGGLDIKKQSHTTEEHRNIKAQE